MRKKATGSLYEKNGVWQMSISYYENVEDPVTKLVTKKRIRKSISTKVKVEMDKKNKAITAKRKAEVILQETLDEWNRGTFSTDKEIPFYQFIETWFIQLEGSIRPTTYESYRLQVYGKIIPYFKMTGISLAELTSDDITAFYQEMRKTVSYNTARHYRANIRQALEWAVKIKKLILYNPDINAIIPKFMQNETSDKSNVKFKGTILDDKEVNKLLKVSKGTVLEVPIYLAVYYGFRREEVLGLKWSAIDFDKNQISIEFTVVDINGKRFHMDDTKTKGSGRYLPMTGNIKNYLLNVKEQQKSDALLYGNSYIQSDFVCRWKDGQPIKPNYISQNFKKFLVKNDIKPVRFHDLRHSAATSLLGKKYSLYDVQKWLGHSDFNTTANIYGHFMTEQKLNIAKGRNSVLKIG
jgi:integrase